MRFISTGLSNAVVDVREALLWVDPSRALCYYCAGPTNITTIARYSLRRGISGWKRSFRGREKSFGRGADVEGIPERDL